MLLLHYSKPVHTKSFNHYEHGDRKGPMPNILICESIQGVGPEKKKRKMKNENKNKSNENICLELDCPFQNFTCIAY